jgi:hypothetical protein
MKTESKPLEKKEDSADEGIPGNRDIICPVIYF